MKTSDIALTVYIFIIFIILNLINVVGIGVENINRNWPQYRCNPFVMPFAGFFGHDVDKNFSYCIQNTQSNYIDHLLIPTHYQAQQSTSIHKQNLESNKSSRKMISNMRSSLGNILSNMMKYFSTIIIEIQRITDTLKDLFAKQGAAVLTMLYILDGSIMTMQSTWHGPPGMMVRALCFHPNTYIKTNQNKIVKMKDIKSGQKLKNGQMVQATMKIHNLDEKGNYIENLYSIPSGEKNKPILVTGSHLIYDNSINNFIHVKDYKNSILTNIKSTNLVCLITSNHVIPLGTNIFHDWEDNQY